jgi:hypothetical protein
MNETAAREVVLVQAFETAQPTPPSWSEEDRGWATRAALDDAGPGGAPAFIARRAHHALQRLGPREPAVTAWLARRLWHRRWVGWALLIGLVAGAFADSIGSSQRINLLSYPLWAVLAWNVVVYVLLLGHGFARLLMRKTQAGSLVKLTERVLRFGRSLPGLGSVSASASGSAKALQGFASQWLRVSAPLSAARAATLLHVAAAALALGLIAGMYLRGLVFDYRAAWESTFLSAANAHAILGVVLTPALALSDIALPDVAAFTAMRSVQGTMPEGAPAAPWIHLLALTLLIVVVLPRTVLALLGAARAHWLARHVALPLQSPYFQGLMRARQGELAQVFVAPYASTPDARAGLALRALITKVLGDTAQVEIARTLAFGAEDDADALLLPPAGTTLAVALFDLAATPEGENHGRFARALAVRAPTILAIDEAAFMQRFKTDPARLAERRDAWRVLAVALGTTPVFINSDAAEESSARGVALALRSPVSPT